LINVSYSEVISQAIQNDKEYIVIRYTDMLGNTNIETIQSVLQTKGYESVDVVGKYVVAKKSK
jgi:methylmalonyl-CoA mutase cobalamin-binding subunit